MLKEKVRNTDRASWKGGVRYVLKDTKRGERWKKTASVKEDDQEKSTVLRLHEQGLECVTTEPRPPVCAGSQNSTGLSHPLNRTHTSGSFHYHDSLRGSKIRQPQETV